MPALLPSSPPSPPSHNEGHGRRLTAAFAALEAYPVLVESRDRVLALFEAGEPSIADVVGAVEADVALAITVLRLSNQLEAPSRGRIETAVAGVRALSPRMVRTIATRAPTFDFFERTTVWQGIPEPFRLHAVTSQRAADRLAREIGFEARDRLIVTSLLHDIGKLVLAQAYRGYPGQIHAGARTPEQRLAAERRELGVDHALVGGVLARRWALPNSIATVIERHHAHDAHGEAALVRLADMLAHYVLGGAISPTALLAVARGLGLKPAQMRKVMYELPLPSDRTAPRQIDPCPMSARELDVLRGLAEGKLYKQIASDLGLSASTVRTHLHNTYRKLGVSDRAQAVLSATQRGWI